MASGQIDVGVLGGGVFGLAAALACAHAGLSVRLWEKRRIGAGASGGLVGMMAPHAPDNWSDKKRFQLAALLSAEDYWADVARRGGVDPLYARVGRVAPIADAAARARAVASVAAARERWPQARMDILADIGWLGPSPLGWLHDTLTARIHPRSALKALAAALRSAGGGIVEGSAPTLEEARRSARHVIVAAGHECAALLPDLGAIGRGVKGQAAMLDFDWPTDRPLVAAPGLYVVGHPGFGVAVGSTSEPDWQLPHETDASLDAIVERARAIVPALSGARVIERWAGVRPRARFPDPVIGPVPAMNRVWLLTGGYKIGFGIAHEMARASVRMILGTPPDLPRRFHLDEQLR